MEKPTFNTKAEYLDYLEGLIGRDISEILKLEHLNYSFKIDSNWYNLASETYVGTDFSKGPCLVLEAGRDVQELERLHLKQFKDDERVKRIFIRLEEAYIKHLAVSNEKSKELVRNILEFLDQCDYIEKYSSNLFIISRDKIKFCFVRNEDYNKSRYSSTIEVKKIVGDNEYRIDTIKDSYMVVSIFKFLEAAYYSSRLTNLNKVTYMITKHLKV